MPPLTDEQKKAIASIDKHVLVSAGAGSGKTFVLVERYINVLQSDPNAGINDIIAVTYTKKAAEEMRSRLKSRLKDLSEKSEGEERHRWIHCLAELESARIGTIHSLCDSILKNYPAEAGIDPSFEILDDLERAELLSQSLDDALHMVIEKPNSSFLDLLEYPIESIRMWMIDFLRSPLKYKESMRQFADCSLEAMGAFAQDLIAADIERSLRELLADKEFISEMSYLIDSPWNDRESRLGVLQNEMLSYLNIIVKESLSTAERWQSIEFLASMDSAKNVGGPAAKEMRSCMRILRNKVTKLAHRHKTKLNDSDKRAFALIKALIELSNDALARYERIKQQHQKLDFDDLIERCQQLLSADHAKTSYALRQLCRTLKAILVDEFQDTNWTQAKMLTALASNKAHLFLIGDDKQSIYKFQGADVGTFNACKTYVSSMHSEQIDSTRLASASNYGLPLLSGQGEEMTLSMSFRSHPQIVNFVNHIFEELFEGKNADDRADDFKSQFQALRPARDGEEEELRIDIIYTPEVADEELEQRIEIDRLESELTADWIQKKVQGGTEVFDKEEGKNRPINYSDFAILLQANGDFAGIETALAKANIPFVSIAGSGFLERQEIFDLENLLKWLVCPQDSHALFAVLRSPIIGFSDDILHELKAGKQASLWQCLMQKSQETGQEELRAARRILQDLQRQAGRFTLPEILRKAVLVTGYDIVLLSAPSGKQKSRNVWKFVALASQHKHMGVAEFLKALKSMRELGVKNLTDAPLCADDAVKIMTIHRSKGLEFAAVALPRLSRGVQQQPRKLLFGKDLAIAFDCTRDTEEEKPAFFVAASNLNRRMDEEEKKRLLYVALTRSRDFLGLFITPRCKRGTNFGKWLIDALGLPDPEGAIESKIMHAGYGDSRCNWNVIQGTESRVSELTPESEFEPKSEFEPQSDFEPAAAFGPGTDFGSGSDFGSGPDFDKQVLLSELAESAVPNFSLLEENPVLEQNFTPVAWQALLRVCPNDPVPVVHPTIAGNYFHLLMGKLGAGLALPSEDDRRALLLHHEVSIQDEAQQELMLRDSERLLLLFTSSKLHGLLKTCRRRLLEHGYTIIRDGKEKELRPDLLIEDQDGNWHIVDFKTDHFELRHIAKQVKSHHAQLATYVEDLHTILGIQAKPWLYFAQHGRLESVDMAAPFQLSLFPL